MSPHTFRIDWIGWDREVCATVTIQRHDLSAAIVAAANMLKRGTGASRDAHGFFVEVER